MKTHTRIVALLAALLTIPSAFGATFNLFQPASGILVGNPSTYITTAATSSNVLALWSGTCNSTTFLRGDGSCQAVPAGAVGANPTGTIGLTAVNGAAATFLRSDGAPPLSQAISPSWTGVHAFTANGNNLRLNGADPRMLINETDGGVDTKNWLVRAVANQFSIALADDASPFSAAADAFVIARTGTVPGTLTWTGGNILNAGSTGWFIGQGASPRFTLNETDVAVDNRLWRIGTSAETLVWGTRNDADNAGFDFFEVERTGTTVDAVILSANSGGSVETTVGPSGISAVSGLSSTAQILNTDANPSYYLNETDAAVDNRLWRENGAAGVLTFSTRNDANNAGTNWLTVGRSGTNIGAITFPANSGLVISGATGGAQGNGTLNATGLFINGVAVSGGGTPGGANTQVQYNNAGAFGGDAGMTYVAGTDTLTVGSIVGDGSGLTALDAGDISAGTLAVARGGTGVTSSTGTGSVVLSASPTLTGTVTAATVAATTVTVGGNNVCQSTGTNCPAGSGTLVNRNVATTDNTVAADCGKVIVFTGAGSQTFTLDADPPVNCVLTFVNNGSASTSLAASTTLQWFNGSGTISTGTRTVAVGGVLTATVFTTQGTWQVWGSGVQ